MFNSISCNSKKSKFTAIVMQLTRNLVSSFCTFNVSLQFFCWRGGGGGGGGVGVGGVGWVGGVIGVGLWRETSNSSR